MLPGKAENLRNLICSCHGSLILGGVNHQFYPGKTDLLFSLYLSVVSVCLYMH